MVDKQSSTLAAGEATKRTGVSSRVSARRYPHTSSAGPLRRDYSTLFCGFAQQRTWRHAELLLPGALPAPGQGVPVDCEGRFRVFPRFWCGWMRDLGSRYSSSYAARLYIVHLSSFSRSICPSTGPVLHGLARAAATASRSRSVPRANASSAWVLSALAKAPPEQAIPP
jgi:hypothetical protein